MTEKNHSAKIQQIANDYLKNKIPNSRNKLISELAVKILYAKNEGVYADYRDCIEIASCFRCTSREILTHLIRNKTDISTRENLLAVRQMLLLAGFEYVFKYNSNEQATKRIWALKAGYSHLTLHEVIKNYDQKLKDASAPADELI